MGAMMGADVDARADRRAAMTRTGRPPGGSVVGAVTLGGRRVPVRRPATVFDVIDVQRVDADQRDIGLHQRPGGIPGGGGRGCR